MYSPVSGVFANVLDMTESKDSVILYEEQHGIAALCRQ